MTRDLTGNVVVISGASAGIGAACAEAFAAAGGRLVLGARRTDRLEALAERLRSTYSVEVLTPHLDVADPESCTAFAQAVVEAHGGCDILINNAGYAEGLDPILGTSEEQAAGMFEANVMGVLRLTRALVPGMLARGGGSVVMLGSIAGRYFYEGGGIYCATKAALRAIAGAMRIELVGQPIRITTIEPGMVETEFSTVRFRGDQARADKVYAGMTPLTPADIAECILFVCTRPPHVVIDDLLITPLDQAYTVKVHREAARV